MYFFKPYSFYWRRDVFSEHQKLSSKWFWSHLITTLMFLSLTAEQYISYILHIHICYTYAWHTFTKIDILYIHVIYTRHTFTKIDIRPKFLNENDSET